MNNLISLKDALLLQINLCTIKHNRKHNNSTNN